MPYRNTAKHVFSVSVFEINADQPWKWEVTYKNTGDYTGGYCATKELARAEVEKAKTQFKNL